MKQNSVAKPFFLYAASFFAVAFILLAVFRLLHIAPFGPYSVATADAYIQYLDFFAYLHDVLHGKANIAYSLSKTLGGTNVAVFSYYLSSPLSFLVYFVEKKDLPAFYDILVLIKLSFAAVAALFFLRHRFSSLAASLSIALALCYALGQYSVEQSRNVIWLDGVYMLPFILWGVYRVMHGKGGLFLSASVGMALLFNWYAGAIDCIFAVFYFVLEYTLILAKRDGLQKPMYTLLHCLKIGARCAIYGIIGVMLASFLLVPTFASLRHGRGHVDWSLFTDISFMAEFPSAVQGMIIGSHSSKEFVSLFCGTLPMLGLLGVLFLPCGLFASRERTVYRVASAIVLLFFCWRPFFTLFSLLKDASSYYYRYAYIGIFFIVFVASSFFERADKQAVQKLFKYAMVYALVLVLLNYFRPSVSINRMGYSVLFIFVSYAVLFFLVLPPKARLLNSRLFLFATVLLVAAAELSANAYILYKKEFRSQNVKQFASYQEEGQAAIDEILSSDTSTYRISQTTTRTNFLSPSSTTANYNESLSFGYRSISGYTSDPDDAQRTLLGRLGYYKNGDNFNITNTSVLPSDSLLGVKYVLSPYPIAGLVQRNDFAERNGKYVYENPYALPFAVLYNSSKGDNPSFEGNCFEYVNNIYSALLGRTEQVFLPLPFVEQTGGGYTVSVKQPSTLSNVDSWVNYGLLDMPWANNATLSVDDVYTIKYAGWCAQSVFYIPTLGEKSAATITLSAPEKHEKEVAYFYAADLSKLSSIKNEILRRNGALEVTSVRDGSLDIRVGQTHEYNSLFISIPYDGGWTIRVNGKKIKAASFADCLFSVPLEAGENNIEMRFVVPGFRLGLALSAIVFILIVAQVFLWLNRKKRH